MKGGNAMVSHLFFYQLVLLGLLWLCCMLHAAWPSSDAADVSRPPERIPPSRKRPRVPKPFPGLTHKPHCEACTQAAAPPQRAPCAPPPRIVSLRGRRRAVDTSRHFCPYPNCAYQGWTGRGNIRANGHPSGGPWRQLYCLKCQGYFQETQGTPMHGKRVSPDLLVWAIGALAEGLGIRAVARVFEVDPNTVLQWLVEVADHAAAFSQYFLHDVRVTQVQLDELFALLSAVKAGEVSEAEAITRLSRSPHWVWAAIDPVTKVLLTLDVGERTLAMAQGVVHQVVQVLAPDCVPLFLTDGFKEYATALLTHYGQWVQPARRQASGPAPKPRWMPLPGLLYAQVIKTVRRRRLVRVTHRVVFGTFERITQVLVGCGWQINTAFVERVNLSIRQHVAAVGRRVITLCKHEAGLRQQLVLYQVYYNFCLPHASLRLPLPQPEPTHGHGSAKRWQPRTPAMAAGLTDHIWTLREVLLFRVPPWPQPAEG
jgi:IS1 family transposase/transposase-like protein